MMTVFTKESLFAVCTAFERGTEIPKPAARHPFRIKGLGMRHGEQAIVYFVPSKDGVRIVTEKGVTKSELWDAYSNLLRTNEFSRAWFNNNLGRAAREGPCNFTTIGGLFELLNIAAYKKKGIYKRL